MGPKLVFDHMASPAPEIIDTTLYFLYFFMPKLFQKVRHVTVLLRKLFVPWRGERYYLKNLIIFTGYGGKPLGRPRTVFD
jgi:hypothetical protein